LVGAPADILRAHDLVGLARLQHAVLVDAGSVREGVRADDGLVRLHDEAGDLRDEARSGHDVRGIEADVEMEEITARLDRHDDLLDPRLEHAAEEIDLRAAAVLGRELDVRAMLAREAHREPRLLEHLLGRHAQLLLHVKRAGGDERVDAPGLGVLQRLDATLDIPVIGATEAANDRVLDGLGDGTHRLEVAVRGGREARFDHIDAHALERARDAQLLLARHRGAGALLAVAHGGVEYDQTLLAHGMSPWPFWAGHSTDCRQGYLARG